MLEVRIDKLTKLDFRSKEAYKMLRTNVEFSGRDIQAIALTSCTPNEGKTSVTFNLALSMADAGKSVIFIDADLRKSVVVGRYKISRVSKGLTHFLSGQNTFDEVVCKTNVEGLHMVLAGPVPPNPSELLGGKPFRELIPQLKKVYDYVIIDTPPLGSVIDSAVIAKECDGVILVVAANEISYKFAQKVKAQLEKTGCRILGGVLNKVAVKTSGYYGKYYGKYYGSYYGSYYGKEEDRQT